MDCSRVTELFSEYIDSVLDEETRRKVEEHLALCPSCAQDLETLRCCVSALSSLDRVKAPVGFLERVHERIERRECSSWLERLKLRLSFHRHVKIPLEAVGLVAALLLVVFIYEGEKQGREPSHLQPGDKAAVSERADSTPRLASQDMPDPRPVPPVSPPRESHTGTSAPSPVPSADFKPLHIVLVIPQRKEESSAFTERVEPEAGGKPANEDPGGGGSGLEAKNEKGVSQSFSSRESQPEAASSEILGSRRRSDKKEPDLSSVTETPRDPVADTEGESAPTGSDRREARPTVAGPKAGIGSIKSEPMDTEKAVAEIRVFLREIGGTVESVELNPATNQPGSLTARIPAPMLARFLDQLGRIGLLREPVAAEAPARGTETILLRVTVELRQ